MPKDKQEVSDIPKEILVYEEREHELNKLCKLMKTLHNNLIIYQTNQIEYAYRSVFEKNLTLIIIALSFAKNGDSEGLALVHTIKRCSDTAFIPVILVSGDELSLRHFLGDLHCFGILDKEYEEIYAEKLLKEALRFPAAFRQKEFIYLKKSSVIYSIRISDILYTEHHKECTIIHTLNERMEFGACSSREILQKLNSGSFLLCAKGIVVNMRLVKSIDVKKRRMYFKDRNKWVDYGASYGKDILAYLQ